MYTPDTNGTEESVHISEVSLFQGLNCLLFFGRKKVSLLERWLNRGSTVMAAYSVDQASLWYVMHSHGNVHHVLDHLLHRSLVLLKKEKTPVGNWYSDKEWEKESSVNVWMSLLLTVRKLFKSPCSMYSSTIHGDGTSSMEKDHRETHSHSHTHTHKTTIECSLIKTFSLKNTLRVCWFFLLVLVW